MQSSSPPVVISFHTPRSSVIAFASPCSYPHSVFNFCQSDGYELTFIVILICIYMMTCEIENPFICLFINHNLLVQFVRFFIGSFFIGSRCFLNVLYIIVCFAHCKYLLSMCGLPFSLFSSILIVKKIYMNIIQFVYVLYFLLNRSALPKDYKDILLYFILKFLRLCF